MRQDPGFKVNAVLGDCSWSLLHYACSKDSRFPVIPLLLAHPDIDVNVKDVYGHTPLYIASDRATLCVREMLKDFRVKVNEPGNDGWTPLCRAASWGHIGAIKTWIASGRELDLGTTGGVDKTDVIRVAKKYDNIEVMTLLERFKANPEETRHTARVELGWYDELAAEMFAMVIFVSDGLLQVNGINSFAARFFTIANQLPLELQIVLCFRFVGSAKEIIYRRHSEVAFKELAMKV